MDGVFLIDKPKGITSHDVVEEIRKLTGLKVGHAGTLDPMATGLLVITVGEGNKLNQYLMSTIKEYLAEITFGIETTTYDADGEVLSRNSCMLNREDIERASTNFIGEIEQVAPKYSAIKQKGVPYYKLARRKIDFKPKSRQVTIFSIEVKDFFNEEYPRAIIEIRCKKGTYIRSLSHDLGQEINGCGGHLSKLVRTASGCFNLDMAVSLDKFNKAFSQGKLKDIMLDLNRAMGDYPRLVCNDIGLERIKNGSPITIEMVEEVDSELESGQTIRAVDMNNKLRAVLIWKGRGKRYIAKPKRVLNID